MKVGKMAVTLLVIVCAVIVTRADDHMYTTKYDDIDIDSVIKNERLLNNYVGCLLDLNPCTPDASELKSMSDYDHSFLFRFDLTLINICN